MEMFGFHTQNVKKYNLCVWKGLSVIYCIFGPQRSLFKGSHANPKVTLQKALLFRKCLVNLQRARFHHMTDFEVIFCQNLELVPQFDAILSITVDALWP